MKRINLVLVFLIMCTISVSAQDADTSLIPYRKGDLWGYADPDKKIIIQPEYAEADFFYEGFAVVKKENKYGYINKEGKVVIPVKFFVAKPFRFGYTEKPGKAKPANGNLNSQKEVLFAGASLQANGYEICIDTKGVTMPKCPAISDNTETEENKENKLTATTAVSNYSTIQKSGLFDKITGDYKIIAGADETYYIATRNNNYGVFNNKFEVIVPFEYSMIEKMNIGAMVYLKAEKAGLKGILFGTGSPYLAVENSKLQHIRARDGSNYFIFTKDGKTGLKNTRYQNIAEPVYYDIVYNENGVFIITADDSLKGFYFPNGKMVIPQFLDITVIKGGAFVKVKSLAGKWGYINNDLIEFFTD